jgi:hypothetical protein
MRAVSKLASDFLFGIRSIAAWLGISVELCADRIASDEIPTEPSSLGFAIAEKRKLGPIRDSGHFRRHIQPAA